MRRQRSADSSDDHADTGMPCLQVMCAKMRLAGSFDFAAIAKKTPGFVGADLSSLTKEAAVVAINRIFRYSEMNTLWCP